ncbi:MAG: LLM class flavin-dependent oxidoreductase [Candidatus Bathyarchaeota archaeon]|nr:LLM class flavin-dependent oxidoreductase [Candidatus Bathyarchaeota archaeon]
MIELADMGARVRFGAHISQEGRDFEDMKNLCLEAENLGFDFFTVMDHFMNQYVPQGKSSIECWTTLAGLAAVTEKIKLGPLVSCYGYHRPTILAKMATTIDIISNGRLIFGIGAGWHEAEFKGFMGRFPSTRERMRGLEESVEICKSMFSNEWTSYHGRTFTVDNAQNKPQPVQRPIPIMVGGAGEKRTLRIAAKHADISHFLSQGSIEEDVRKFSVLKKHCEAVGRNYDEIVRGTGFGIFMGKSKSEVYSRAKRLAGEVGGPPGVMEYWLDNRTPTYGVPENFVETFNSYIEKGITFFTCVFFDINDMRIFSEEVIPEVL